MLLLLSFAISLGSAVLAADSCPILVKDPRPQLREGATKFLNKAKEEGNKEHVLPPNSDPNILKLQRWTKTHENYMKKQAHSGELAIYVVQNRVVSQIKNSDKLLALFKLYTARAAKLSGEVFREYPTHFAMITDHTYAKNYKAQFMQSLKSILPDDSGKPGQLEQFDCDYLNQPVNALYFNLSALAVIDGLGKDYFGECWEQQKQALYAEDKNLQSLPMMVKHIQEGAAAATKIAAKTKKKSSVETADASQAASDAE